MSLPAPWPSISRTCKSTAINKTPGKFRPLADRTLPGSFTASRKVVFAALLLLLTSCTSVRPIVKIGLIAPFEGLYRESGYASLAAMRQALADCTPPGLDVLPVALDDSGDPAKAQRAAQKLLVDPAVRAIVGPLLLESVPAVATVITPTAVMPWYIPPLVNPEGGFSNPSSEQWLTAQVEYVAKNSPADHVLLGGLPIEWQLAAHTTISTTRVDDLDTALATLQETGTEEMALLWLGRPDMGARWLSKVQDAAPQLDFWLADQAGIAIFAAHAASHSPNWDRSHWLIWTDVEYNQWSQPDGPAIQPSDAMRYLTYRATCAALQRLGETPSSPSGAWELQSRPIE